LGSAQLDEIDEDDGIPHDYTRARNEADPRSRGNKRIHQHVCREDADQRQRVGAMITRIVSGLA
jgi:hypothetical protein